MLLIQAYVLISSWKENFWYSEAYLLTQINISAEGTLSMQNAKL